ATKVLQEASTSIRPLEVLQPSPVQNSKLEVPVINQLQRPIASLPKEEPSSSGRNAEAVKVKEAKQSKSDRKSRKAEKKEKSLQICLLPGIHLRLRWKTQILVGKTGCLAVQGTRMPA
ncbi:hypothetical protein EJB05_55562, partial [Eragrostis curvula]